MTYTTTGLAEKERLADVWLWLASLIPAEAIRHGWNISNLTHDFRQTGEWWEVSALGPVAVMTELRQWIDAGPLVPEVRVDQGCHGTLAGRTPEDLARLIKEWIVAVWR